MAKAEATKKAAPKKKVTPKKATTKVPVCRNDGAILKAAGGAKRLEEYKKTCSKGIAEQVDILIAKRDALPKGSELASE